MLNRATTSYGLGAAGIGYSAKTMSNTGEATTLIPDATTLSKDSIWYDLFPSLVESGMLTQVNGKFFFDGMMVSDIISISVGVISGLGLLSRFAGDIYFFFYKRRLDKLERELKEKEK